MNRNDEYESKNAMIWDQKRRRDPSDLVIPLRYIDNFKKLLILWAQYGGGQASMPPSSSGSGHLSFKEATGIRLPLGVGYYEKKLIVDYQ